LTTPGRAAAFLDRDGTINVERGYVTRPEDIVLIEGAAAAIRALNEAGVLVVIVSNQSGIARGLMTEDDMAAVHAATEALLNAEGARVDAAYYCPSHPDGEVAPFTSDTSCRKPETGMADAAVRDLGVDLGLSTMVGDNVSDIEFANNAGMAAVLVKTGKGADHMEKARARGARVDAYVDDLAAAVEWILSGRPGWESK